jgi:hypothetical protein
MEVGLNNRAEVYVVSLDAEFYIVMPAVSAVA